MYQTTSLSYKEERKPLLNDLRLISGRDLVGKHQPGSTEETTSTSTKTETGKDGSKTTTTTTTTTKKTQGNSPWRHSSFNMFGECVERDVCETVYTNI